MGLASALARSLIRLFVIESGKLLAEIERAVAVPDSQALSRAAHSLKSSSGSLGACLISSIARELEALADAGQAGALVAHAARLRVAYEVFCQEPVIRELLLPEAPGLNAA